jgi:GNAT superfamily N-acetyltransferase
VDGVTAGWVNASRRADYTLGLIGEPDGVDPSSVIGVSCFVISPPYRRHGVAAALLDHVIGTARERGASWVEGYPRTDQDNDAGHFRGPTAMYEAKGFEPVTVRERDTVMRKQVI